MRKMAVLFVLGALSTGAIAQELGSDSSALSPANVGEIQRFFGDPQNKVQIQFASDKTQYAWQNMSRFYQTATVPRTGKVNELPVKSDPSIGDIKVTLPDGRKTTVDEFIEDNPFDAFLVVHKGRIVYERYETMRPFDKHNWFSVGKVIGATLLAILEEEGKADLSKPVSHYIKELKGSAWDDVPLQLAADMVTGLDGTEHDEPSRDSRTNPEQIWFQWAATMGIFPPNQSTPDSPWDVLATMKQRLEPGTVFEYNSINTFVVDVAVERITDQTLNEVFSERVWRKIGAEGDGYYAVGASGEPLTFGFYNSNLRDLARFGMIFTPSWNFISEEPIITDSILERIQSAGDPKTFDSGAVPGNVKAVFPEIKGLTNTFQWDVIFPDDGDLFKAGVGGQGLYISPERDAVVVFFMTGTGTEPAPAVARAITLALGKTNGEQGGADQPATVQDSKAE